eukprot:6182173-Pleurochrysis_carterae.AAC.2
MSHRVLRVRLMLNTSSRARATECDQSDVEPGSRPTASCSLLRAQSESKSSPSHHSRHASAAVRLVFGGSHERLTKSADMVQGAESSNLRISGMKESVPRRLWG